VTQYEVLTPRPTRKKVLRARPRKQKLRADGTKFTKPPLAKRKRKRAKKGQ
jgi:hypothetical protein